MTPLPGRRGRTTAGDWDWLEPESEHAAAIGTNAAAARASAATFRRTTTRTFW